MVGGASFGFPLFSFGLCFFDPTHLNSEIGLRYRGACVVGKTHLMGIRNQPLKFARCVSLCSA